MPPLCAATSSLHHLEIHGSGSGVTCSPSTLTIVACLDAACASAYTGGVSGNLSGDRRDRRAQIGQLICLRACVPAFGSVSKALTFVCTYQSPGSGGLPVRVGGSALNASNRAAAER